MGKRLTKAQNVLISIKWLMFWISLAVIFNIGVYIFLGKVKALEFTAGYLIELSLSIDNVFVFLMIFMSFGVNEHTQHRVLRWGIMGAIVLRLVFVLFGVAVVNQFEWLLHIFGLLLIFTGIKMFKKDDKEKDPHDSRLIKIMKKFVPLSDSFDGEKFFTKKNGKLFATPLFAVLILVESSDIMFAIDSVPAVLSVSRDLFIVYTSNIFAILGLRQLFFVVEHMQEKFQYVRYGVAIILVYTGVKMGIGFFGIKIPTYISICVIIGVLVVSIVSSIMVSIKIDKKRKELK